MRFGLVTSREIVRYRYRELASAAGMASPSSRAARIGMLTPSSNTVLEPTVQAMLAQSTATCTAHFSRFTVTEIGLNERQLSQFDPAPIVAAAELLGHAHCGAISWAGTSGSWLGLEQDTALCGSQTGNLLLFGDSRPRLQLPSKTLRHLPLLAKELHACGQTCARIGVALCRGLVRTC